MRKKIHTYLKRIGLLLIVFGLIYFHNPQTPHASEADPIGNAKNGIVEVFSGFFDREGKFLKMKSGSGFLINNTEGTTYIVTNSTIIRNSSEEKAAYCKANGIETEDFGMTDGIRVVVKGDVTIEAAVLAQSSNMDFCILSTENAVNEKVPLKLGDSASLATGDEIYALGFPKDTENLEFQASDVEIFEGSVQDKDSNQSGTGYVQHSAAVSGGNTGGPILDAEGYVVGINCAEHSDKASGRYYSLPVNELAEVLDNFAIQYGSKKQDVLQKDLDELREECIGLSESGEYKKASLAELQIALANAEKLAETENPTLAEVEENYEQLKMAKDALVPKMEKIKIAIYVLAGVVGLLLVIFLWLFILDRKAKKKESSAQNNLEHTETAAEQPMEKELRDVPHTETAAAQKTFWHMEDGGEKTVGLPSYRRNYSADKKKEEEFLQRTTDLELVRVSTGQAAKVDKAEFWIGKNPSQADFFVPDNSAVSRRHASIIWKDNEYYICDAGSVNGTYIKGAQIPKGIPMKLSDGDDLRLADEEFLVRISDV